MLITGISGAGKTYCAERLQARGIEAFDADAIAGLGGWYNFSGQKVPTPPDNKLVSDFLHKHDYLWDKDFLAEFLKAHEEVLLFGYAGNIFETTQLFDALYFLHIPAS